MEILDIQKKSNIEQDPKLLGKYMKFERLLYEIKQKNIPSIIVDSINQIINDINSYIGSNKGLSKKLNKAQSKILNLIEKELKLVTINHYRNLWMALGIAMYGIPLGVLYGIIFENMAFIGIGLPIGLVVGMAIGMTMDKKARKNGNQLNIEI